jgi:hypothetical protein
LAALTELGNLALAGGFRSAARTAYIQAVQHHPGDTVSRVNLANLLYGDENAVGARLQYEAALAQYMDSPCIASGVFTFWNRNRTA